MKTVLKGYLDGSTPQVRAQVDENRVLVLGKEGNLELTLDTGFSADISVPAEVLDRLNVEHVGFENYVLATGAISHMPVYRGKVRIGRNEIEARFIPADFLVGTELMAKAASRLVVDFERETVTLQRR